nr:MAG TPA: hypothetical protein [Caudoviricetes sp.]
MENVGWQRYCFRRNRKQSLHLSQRDWKHKNNWNKFRQRKMEHYWDEYRLQRGYRSPIRLFDRKRWQSSLNGAQLLLLHVLRLYKPYNSTGAARNYAGGQLLLLHVPRLYEPYNSTGAARNYAGDQLLLLHVPRLYEPYNSTGVARN